MAKHKCKNKRKNIPEKVKLKLWVKSGGLCEFKGCNKPVWYNDLTLSDGNFAEVAHIIGSSEDGPRGTSESEKLQTEYSNLMLLCQRCHKEIDDNEESYSIKLLQDWKTQHEKRIELLLNNSDEMNQSTILKCSVNIGERPTPLNPKSFRKAIFPKYPADLQGVKIEEKEFDINGNTEYWQKFAEDRISKKIHRYFDEGIDDVKIKHLSIFAFAPIPLLMFLGKCIGDTVPTDIYPVNRLFVNTEKVHLWLNEKADNFKYFVNEIEVNNGKKVVLKLSLSDYIEKDKFQNLVNSATSIYEITISEPTPHFLTNLEQLKQFSIEYRKLLNLIQARHGKDCEILILPAIPIPIAIECGRILLPTKDLNIYACQIYEKDFKKVLQIV